MTDTMPISTISTELNERLARTERAQVQGNSAERRSIAELGRRIQAGEAVPLRPDGSVDLAQLAARGFGEGTHVAVERNGPLQPDERPCPALPPEEVTLKLIANGYVVMHEPRRAIAARDATHVFAFTNIDAVLEHIRWLYVKPATDEEVRGLREIARVAVASVEAPP